MHVNIMSSMTTFYLFHIVDISSWQNVTISFLTATLDYHYRKHYLNSVSTAFKLTNVRNLKSHGWSWF